MSQTEQTTPGAAGGAAISIPTELWENIKLALMCGYTDLADASTVVDKSEGEEYAYDDTLVMLKDVRQEIERLEKATAPRALGVATAGSTGLPIGTRVRITKIAEGEPDDQGYVGMTGKLTHPFPGLMTAPASEYIAGLWLDPDEARQANITVCGPCGTYPINLCTGDAFEVVDN